MATQPNQHISVEEYLEREAVAVDRHEYLNGEIFLMAGGTPAHSLISTHLITTLNNQLTDMDCNVRGPDMGIRTSVDGLYSYADVVVSCAEEQFDRNILLNPVLVIEVLSESTESYDRGKKFELYRQIQSFSEYLVVAQDRIYIEHHVRGEGLWVMRVYKDRDLTITLQMVPAVLRISNVYAKVL